MAALLGLAVAVAAAVAVPTTAHPVAPGDSRPSTSAVVRPRIVSEPIGFGPRRRHQMARYSTIHYGRAEWRLRPRGIVEHFTATRSLASVFATFRSNAPDPELGQRPGTCAHFVIDRDGTIYQLVSTHIRCRHTVGLNHRTIGIEHVAMSDGEVMGNARQRRASLRLTAWLVDRFDLSAGDVIGHAESLSSRLHHEKYGPWRCQTHGDFARSTMNRYRARLRTRLHRAGLPAAGPQWVASHC